MVCDNDEKICDVILKIAENENVHYESLPNINDYVDVECLTGLINSDSDVFISFKYLDYTISWVENKKFKIDENICP
jgi:hypothetical protein